MRHRARFFLRRELGLFACGFGERCRFFCGDFFRRGASGGGALENFNLGIFAELIERVSLASGGDVHVQLDASEAVSFDGRGAILFHQLLKLIIGFAGNKGAEFDPALDFLRGADAYKTLLALKDFYAFAVVYAAYAVIHGGDVVAQIGRGRGDVHDFSAANGAGTLAGSREQHEQQGE